MINSLIAVCGMKVHQKQPHAGVWNARSAVGKALNMTDLTESEMDALHLTKTGLMEAGDTPTRVLSPGPPVSGGGGGGALIFQHHLKLCLSKHHSFSSFENMEVCLTRGKHMT